MHRFLIDEDMPRSTANALRSVGHIVEDVRDVGLRGHSDAEVFAYAQHSAAVLVSCDKGFANMLAFPAGSHAGIIVVRIPDEAPPGAPAEWVLSPSSHKPGFFEKSGLSIHPPRKPLRKSADSATSLLQGPLQVGGGRTTADADGNG